MLKPDHIGCDGICQKWFHKECVDVDDVEFAAFVGDTSSEWFCRSCCEPTSDSEPSTMVQSPADVQNSCTVEIDIPPMSISNGDLWKAKWGKLSGPEIATSVNKAYKKIVKWRRNIFLLPSGQAGKAFIEEMTKTINFFTSTAHVQSVSLTMVIIMPALLLQKPSKKSKSKDHVAYLTKMEKVGMV